MPFSDDYFMNEALQHAIFSFKANEVPVGAIVVFEEKIIVRTHNLTELLHDVTAHAEIQAIRKASYFFRKKYLQECTLYVTLEPCVMCAGALYWAQLGRVVFGAYAIKRGFLNAGVSLHPKTQITSYVLAEKSQNLLKKFFTKKRKRKKG